MNSREEELQKKLEKGQLPHGNGLDVKAYQEVFRALKKDPGYPLSPNFAERVVARAFSRQQNTVLKDYLWFGAGMFFMALAFAATVLYTNFRFDFGFLNVMADYKGLVIFGIVFIIFLNWLDKRLVHARQG